MGGGILLVIVFFILNSIIIFKGHTYFIHSDGATAILFAREQWAQKKLHPSGWCYGTDIWNVGLNTLILPFFKLCRHWVNARACAVVVQTAVMLFVMLWFRKAKVLNEKIWVVLLLMLLPVSEVVSEHWYFQATYMTMILFLSVMILLTLAILSGNRRKSGVAAVILLIILCFRISMGYTMIPVFSLPMLITMIIQVVRNFHVEQERHERFEINKKYLEGFISIAAGTLLGCIYNRYLLKVCNTIGNSTADFKFIDYKDVNLERLLQGLFRVYGVADKASGLISRSGILKAVAVIYMFLMLLAVPYLLMKNFKNLKNEYQRCFIIFSMVSTLAVIYLYIFTGMKQARYLLWIYFYSIIWFGICIDNAKLFRFEYLKELKCMLVLYFTILFCGVYGYYITYDYEDNPDVLGVNNDDVFYKADYGLVEHLKEKGYHFGYAYYWAAYNNYVISDGEVTIAGLQWSLKSPYLWLTSENWYQEDAYDGNCFIMIADDMMDHCPDIYKERATEQDKCGSYTIFLFDNIGVVKDMWNEMAE